jgi:hypothetical protein
LSYELFSLSLAAAIDKGKEFILFFLDSEKSVTGILLRRLKGGLTYVMDKGYDSENIHYQVREELNADSVIPNRSWKNELVGGSIKEKWMNISMKCDTISELLSKRNSLT